MIKIMEYNVNHSKVVNSLNVCGGSIFAFLNDGQCKYIVCSRTTENERRGTNGEPRKFLRLILNYRTTDLQ